MFLSNDPTAKDARAIVARRTIEEDDKHKAYSVDGRAQVTLQDALVEQLKKLGPLPDDPPFAADHRLADLLETLGAEGVDQARRLRKASKDREATGKAPKVWRFERVTARATLLDDKLFPGSQFDDLQVIDPAGYVPNSTGVEHDPAEVSSSIVVLEDEWSLDFTAMPVAIRMLAHATWIDVVLPRLGNPAALARAVCTDVLDRIANASNARSATVRRRCLCRPIDGSLCPRSRRRSRPSSIAASSCSHRRQGSICSSGR